MKTTLPILLLFVSSATLADSAFDGTWKTDPKSVKLTGKTIAVRDKDVAQGQTATYTLVKQP